MAQAAAGRPEQIVSDAIRDPAELSLERMAECVGGVTAQLTVLAPRQTQQLVRASNCETIRPAERDTSARTPEKLVRTYRLYIIDPFNGGIAETRRFAVPDHETAVWISEGFRHSRPMELLNGPTKIRSCSCNALFREILSVAAISASMRRTSDESSISMSAAKDSARKCGIAPAF